MKFVVVVFSTILVFSLGLLGQSEYDNQLYYKSEIQHINSRKADSLLNDCFRKGRSRALTAVYSLFLSTEDNKISNWRQNISCKDNCILLISSNDSCTYLKVFTDSVEYEEIECENVFKYPGYYSTGYLIKELCIDFENAYENGTATYFLLKNIDYKFSFFYELKDGINPSYCDDKERLRLRVSFYHYLNELFSMYSVNLKKVKFH